MQTFARAATTSITTATTTTTTTRLQAGKQVGHVTIAIALWPI